MILEELKRTLFCKMRTFTFLALIMCYISTAPSHSRVIEQKATKSVNKLCDASECCKYPFQSPKFNKCCNRLGCCPVKCRTSDFSDGDVEKGRPLTGPKKKSCKDKFGTHPHKSYWKNPKKPCIEYSCRNGKIMKAVMACSLPLCSSSPVYTPGVCCPTYNCSGCTDDSGVYHANGETWTDPVNPCYFYSCGSGQIATAVIDCPPPPTFPCLAEPVYTSGECCPQYNCATTTKAAVNGKRH